MLRCGPSEYSRVRKFSSTRTHSYFFSPVCIKPWTFRWTFLYRYHMHIASSQYGWIQYHSIAPWPACKAFLANFTFICHLTGQTFFSDYTSIQTFWHRFHTSVGILYDAPASENLFWLISHSNGFSPVCVFVCCLRWLSSVRTYSWPHHLLIKYEYLSLWLVSIHRRREAQTLRYDNVHDHVWLSWCGYICEKFCTMIVKPHCWYWSYKLLLLAAIGSGPCIMR